jgi:Fic family protein
MIEQPPKYNADTKSVSEVLSPEAMEEIRKFQEEYPYWSKVKYKKLKGFDTPENIWNALKQLRLSNQITANQNYRIHFSMTNSMARLCHNFDMQFGGSWGSESLIPRDSRKIYLMNSVIDEAISSSQMEGASTTRKVAKEMLRNKITPKDKSQWMIYNNYQTIQFLSENLDQVMTSEFLLHIHSLMTYNTMDNPEDAGRFRQNDNVVVANSVTNEIVHIPPSFTEIPAAVNWFCQFANSNELTVFIHPIIKGAILHYFISYLHPFVDGNGRTARAIFYWYLLKEGYWLTEYLSISRIIYKSKAAYEKSFLQSEADGNDIGYFITYHLNALEKAFDELKSYIEHKSAQKKEEVQLLKIGGITKRQASILHLFIKDADLIITAKDIAGRMLISQPTAKKDLSELVQSGLLTEIKLNKQKSGYIKGPDFDSIIDNVI